MRLIRSKLVLPGARPAKCLLYELADRLFLAARPGNRKQFE
jgi:hypothetical protein